MSARMSWLDVKLGLRMMVKHPALTLVGGLGMAVGIGISVAFFSVTRTYLYPTLPLDEGERVVALENRDVAIDNEERRSLHDFITWREELRSVEDLTAFRTVQRNLITGVGPPEVVQVAELTASGFRLARVPALLGRHLTVDDEREGAAPVLVIGYHVWRNRFAGDPGVIGRDVRLGGVSHTVVGVAPEGFAFPESHAFWRALRERLVGGVAGRGWERRCGAQALGWSAGAGRPAAAGGACGPAGWPGLWASTPAPGRQRCGWRCGSGRRAARPGAASAGPDRRAAGRRGRGCRGRGCPRRAPRRPALPASPAPQ